MRIDWYAGRKQKLKKDMQQALEKTAEAVKTDLVTSQTMPFRMGILQNDSTYTDTSKSAQGVCSVVSSTPYARRLYYNPQFNFDQSTNAEAGGEWFVPYISGGKRNFARDAYRKFIRQERA